MSELYQDLLKDTSESFEDGNYFLVTIVDLELGQTYPLEFQWKYKDGTVGKDWSAVYPITTPFKTVPGTPQFLSGNVVGGAGAITIEWNGKDSGGSDLTDIDRVEVWISEPPFDSTKPAYSSKTKFKTQLQAPAGSYTVALYAVTVNGQYSAVSSAFTVNVTSVATPVSPPTLPTGLSVATAPFAVSVNWGGSYSGSNFDGFKSIDIHVRSSDVGSTATSGFSTTTQVATLTVNSTTNRQNIGLDNLRQALSLASNDAAYTAPMFFYYIARNTNDALYSVAGTPTYTRINSSSVNPTKANFVDLASGVISIENLVAGNGNFSSWLRAGSAGGTRIELSAVNDFTNSGYTVQKGLVAYSSGSTEIFNLDIDAGTLVINGSGTFTGNLSIGSGNSIFKAEPATGIWLGNTSYGSAPFRVSTNGALKSESGDIAGWQINPTFLQNTSGTFKISSTNTDPQIQVGSDSSGHIRISAGTGVAHYSSGTTLSNKFTLSPTGTSQISGWTIGTDSISSPSGNIFLYSAGKTGDTTLRIQAGSGGQFKVYDNGSIFASSAEITGKITATDGAINGDLSVTKSLTSGGGTTYLGKIRLNGENNSLEFLDSGTTVVGKMYTFLTNSEIIMQYGNTQALGYPASTSYVSLSSNQVTLGISDSSGVPTDTISLTTSGTTFRGGSVNTITGSSIVFPSFRNISAGTSAPESNPNLSVSYTGDIYIQY